MFQAFACIFRFHLLRAWFLGLQLHRKEEVLEPVSTLGLQWGLSPHQVMTPLFYQFHQFKCKQRSVLHRATPCRPVYTSKWVTWPCHISINVFPGSPASCGKGTVWGGWAGHAEQRCGMLRYGWKTQELNNFQLIQLNSMFSKFN